MRTIDMDRRILGAIRCVDVNTSLPIDGELLVKAEGLQLVRNRLGDYVITGAPGFPVLDDHTYAFKQAPASPTVGSIEIGVAVADATNSPGASLDKLVRELADRYLPRRATIRLPRESDPRKSEDANSLFRPIEIPLYPALGVQPPQGATLIRAIVRAAGTKRPLPGALVRVTRQGGSESKPLGQGMTHWSGHAIGEAVVPVLGIPLTTWDDLGVSGNEAGTDGASGEGTDAGTADGDITDDDATVGDGAGESPVLTTEVPVTVQAIWDPEFDLAGGAIPDPEDLAARRDKLPSVTSHRSLAFGRHIIERLSITIPDV